MTVSLVKLKIYEEEVNVPWKTLKIETRKLTRQLVCEFTDMTRLPNDRELRGRRTVFLKGEVDAGRFRTCEWASVHCKETGETYRVNGKHTSTMFSQMDDLPAITVVVERFECDTMKDAAELYSTFDAKESGRTSSDINFAIKASIPQLASVVRRTADTCVTGMAYALYEDGYASKETALERAIRLEEEWGFVLWASQFLVNGGHTIQRIGANLSRSPVVAAMYRTYKVNAEVAQEFWTLVREEAADTKDATRTLARYLLTAAVRTGAAVPGKKTASPREMYIKCIHAWNAWCAGEPTALKFYGEKETPTVSAPGKRMKKAAG